LIQEEKKGGKKFNNPSQKVQIEIEEEGTNRNGGTRKRRKTLNIGQKEKAKW